MLRIFLSGKVFFVSAVSGAVLRGIVLSKTVLSGGTALSGTVFWDYNVGDCLIALERSS